jgi:hypothetical protein
MRETRKKMTPNTATNTESRNGLWLWVGLAFGLLIAAWVAFFIIAGQHKVEEVPLQTQPAQTH